MLIKKNIQYEQITIPYIPTGVEAMGIRLESQSLPINLFNIYIPPNIKLYKNTFNKFIASITSREKVIISGDHNAHHSC